MTSAEFDIELWHLGWKTEAEDAAAKLKLTYFDDGSVDPSSMTQEQRDALVRTRTIIEVLNSLATSATISLETFNPLESTQPDQ